MGCICSKAVTRSMSLREELNYGFQSTAVAWDELISSHTGNGNDHLFAFVRSANNSKNNKISIIPNPETDLETAKISASTSIWDDLLIPEFKAEREMSSGQGDIGESVRPGQGDIGEFVRPRSLNRSKSCQNMLREQEPDKNDRILNESRSLLDWKDRNLMGSRSFHTVEEFDALLERIRKADSGSTESIQGEDQKEDVGTQTNTEDSFKELADNSEGLDRKMDNSFKNDGTGWRRKAVAKGKGLRSLDVPSIEFPAVGKLRQWTQVEGQVYSSETYVTPKFGSYNHKKMAEATPGENSAFSPELVAAFEDCMQQLKEEEETILSRMDEYLPPSDEAENQAGETQVPIFTV